MAEKGSVVNNDISNTCYCGRNVLCFYVIGLSFFSELRGFSLDLAALLLLYFRRKSVKTEASGPYFLYHSRTGTCFIIIFSLVSKNILYNFENVWG